jgi:hypothetical protein
MTTIACHVCGGEVYVYDTPETAVCPDHCRDHDFKYDPDFRERRCTRCDGSASPDDYYSGDD